MKSEISKSELCVNSQKLGLRSSLLSFSTDLFQNTLFAETDPLQVKCKGKKKQRSRRGSLQPT